MAPVEDADDDSALNQALRSWRDTCVKIRKASVGAAFDLLARQVDPGVAAGLEPLIELQWFCQEPGRATPTRIRSADLPRTLPFTADEVCAILAHRSGHRDALIYRVTAMPAPGLVSFGPGEQVDATFRITASDYGMASQERAIDAKLTTDPVVAILSRLEARLDAMETRIGAIPSAASAPVSAPFSAETLGSIVGEAVGRAVAPVLSEVREHRSVGLSGDNITEIVVSTAPLLLGESRGPAKPPNDKLRRMVQVAKLGVFDRWLPGASSAAEMLGAFLANPEDDEEEGDDDDDGIGAIDQDDASERRPAVVGTAQVAVDPEYQVYLTAKRNLADGGFDFAAFAEGMADPERARAYTEAIKRAQGEGAQ